MASVSKEQLRNLMRKAQAERQQSNATTTQRVVHPCAKYSRSGDLTCSACNKRIRNEQFWKSHLLSAEHRQNTSTSLQPDKRKYESSTSSNHEANGLTHTKLAKVEKANANQRDGQSLVEHDGALPAGFFDEPSSAVADAPLPTSSKLTPLANSSDQLPSDFFDSQKQEEDARRLEREMETFQREIATVIDRSEQLVDADDDQVQVERELLETDELLSKWSRVNQLEKEVDMKKSLPRRTSTTVSDRQHESSSSESDSESENENEESEEFEDEQSALSSAFEWRSKR